MIDTAGTITNAANALADLGLKKFTYVVHGVLPDQLLKEYKIVP